MSPTENRSSAGPSLVVLGLGVLVVAGALLVRFGTTAPGATPTTKLPADIVALGSSVEPLAPEGAVSSAEALKIAQDRIGPQFESAKVESFLVTITDPDTPDLTDRGVWIVKVSNIAIPVSGGPDPSHPLDRRATLAYIYVDAITGEWITTAMRIQTF